MRYRLETKLGAGGMGVVYRAFDRLTGQRVALKRVTAAGDPGRDEGARVALANEFALLASLRHPHVISVLDYGFDALPENGSGASSGHAAAPFFTMTYLEGARSLVDAARGQPRAVQVRLLVEALQALAYLHRRGIVHRDMKPEHALVVPAPNGGSVRLLDFGLAALHGSGTEVAGTLAYIAPETIDGAPVTPLSDLYALGVIAYEVFTGIYPYDYHTVTELVNAIARDLPPLDRFAFDDPLVAVVGRLLAKDPEERYTDAETTIAALCAAAGVDAPQESIAVRESYLQAANFVGRAAELGALLQALDAILPITEPQPDAPPQKVSGWLVGGESGVGKTRLVEELRVRAQVRGVRVLRGQAVAEGGMPYTLWHDVVRWLALLVPLEETEAATLQTIVTDLGVLLERDVPRAPELEPQAAQQRAIAALSAVLRRAAVQPTLLIMEDLHWASESLDLLRTALPLTTDLPLLVVATYRDDERPHLPDLLPGMRVMKLERLRFEETVELAVSMLGSSVTGLPQVVDLLQRETEGNVLFVVEVVRALAEDAGSLHRVGQVTLPARVFAGGMKELLRRRLERMPEDGRALVRLAAVAGRALDMEVLRAAAGTALSFDDWLTDGINAAVFEPLPGGGARFAHDKLREAALDDLPDAERAALHRRVARAIETVYHDDQRQAMVLMYHWRNAGDPERERHYCVLAGETALAVSAFQDAVTCFQRALALEHPAEARLRALLGEAYLSMGDYAEALSQLEASIELARLDEDVHTLALALSHEGTIRRGRGQSDAARDLFAGSLLLARRVGDARIVVRALIGLGLVAYAVGEYERARGLMEEAVTLARAGGVHHDQATALRRLGMVLDAQGEFHAALAMYRESLVTAEAIGFRAAVAAVHNNIGLVETWLGSYDAAAGSFRRALATDRETGDRLGMGITLFNLAYVLVEQGRYDEAESHFRESAAVCRAADYLDGLVEALDGLGVVARHHGDYARARAHHEEALTLGHSMNSVVARCTTNYFLGVLEHALGSRGEALRCLRESLALAASMPDMPFTLRALVALADLLYAEGQAEQAARLCGAALEHRMTLHADRRRAQTLAARLQGDHAAALERGVQGDALATARAWLGEG